MAVYYKFKSAKDYDSIPIDGHFITVASLKEKIYESKQLGRGTDYDLVVTNAQTNEEYLDEDMLIPKNTSVLIRRIPGQPRMPIVAAPVTEQAEPKVVNDLESAQSAKSNFSGAGLSFPNYLDGSEYDEFGNDLYEIPEVVPIASSNQLQDAPAPSKADEDSKIQALIDTPALDWQQQNFDGFGAGRGFGRGMGGRMGGRGFGRGGGFERKTPPPGYVCHRCKTPGHFIQHCPTNGDPNFDIKRVKPPTGIPKSMLMATPDGSYALPSGAVAVLRPNEAAFEKEIEGMPSTRTVGDLPPELHCPLCKEVMKDAVLTSKCCFTSFCDKCIRDHIISKAVCVCGATNVLADDLLPNKTLRDTINRILESNNSSAENGGSAFHVQDMESARCAPPQPKIASPSRSAASKGEQAPPPNGETTMTRQGPGPAENDADPIVQQPVSGKGKIAKAPDVSEATYESKSMMEPASQGSARVADDEVQQKQVPSEAAKKKKKKKVNMPISAAEMQWRASQDFAAENYMMPPGPSPYNPYWNGMQPGMDAFMGPYGGGMPYMGGYGLGPMDVPFGGMFPQDPFGVSGLMMPPFIPPQRDLAELGMGMNGGGHGGPGGPPIMSREEFEARRAELKWKRDFEKRGGGTGSSRELPKERDFSRDSRNNEDAPSMKSKSRPIPPPSSDGHRHRTERPSPERRHSRDDGPDVPPHPSSKRKSSSDRYDYDDYDDANHHHHHHAQQHKSHRRSESSTTRRPPQAPLTSDPKAVTAAAAASAATSASDRKHKPSVFSRISFPEEEAAAAAAAASKKRKLTSSSSEAASAGGPTAVSRKSSTNSSAAGASVDYESSDDDRHFKRRPSRYESSPARERERERERDRDRDRDRDREHYSKHR
ncbi:E3 ubiquitin ligase PARAQUAT TOLERANCE 3 isoform X1 [Cynara cardunculus var. scolymus]|uniref:E3 ubiquitin ligase PARAQUAT TOLERANCE 3 isoform X1 n=1 Tax=Cynara cardunculus var. scolymus TaxID=59895 RepID=UPI000D62551D|nr:E3 ubiquitin ligase PARAQUAT TOLERANCE 3 isoform X1 [Cynara cardunculus var. scolymus]